MVALPVPCEHNSKKSLQKPANPETKPYRILGSPQSQRIPQFLLIIARRFSVALFSLCQRGGDDFLAGIDFASLNQGPQTAAVVGHVVALLLVE